MPEVDFTVSERKAEAYVRYLTYANGDIFEVESEAVKRAICAVAEVYYAESSNRKKSGGAVVKSENNDGYSVTYVTEQVDGQTAEQLVKKKAYEAMYPYLLPTGWLNRKARCCHARQCGHHDLQP